MPITPVADETQPQAQPVAQPQVTPTPDPAHVILSAAQTDDKTKADAWEIYHNHEGKEFEDKLAATSLPQDAKSALWQAKTRAATTAQQMKAHPQAQPKQDVVENFLDADVKKSIPGTPSLKPVYETGKGLYQGLVGEEATPDIKGAPTGTAASPNNPAGVANYGVTPGNVGYNVGKMGHGIYEFGKGLVQDIAGNTPIAVPDTVAGKPNASFWDRVKGIGDPTAHTLMAKYVTAPSMAEREASEKEMEEYFKTKGPGAAGHAISAFLHGTLGEYVPAVGPLAMALTDQAQKGDIGGAMAQIAALYAFEKGTGAAKKGIKERVSAATADLTKTPEVKQAEANVDALGKARDAAQAKLDAAKAQHQAYTASHEQGIGSPEKVANEVKKAQDVYDEAEAHHEIAKEDLAKKQAESTIPKQVGGAVGRAVGKVLPTPAPEPEAPITAAPALKAPGPAPKIPQIGVSPAHATTTIPQEPTPAPKVPGYGRIELANGQGTMGMPKLLTEGTPEVKPEAKPAEAPKPVTDEGALRDLKATKGEVVESPEKKVGRLLQEALKPAEKAPEYAGEERRETERKPLMSPVEIEEAMKNRKPVHTPFDVTQGAMETIKRDQAMPKHPAEEAAVKEQPILPKEEPTGYAAKKEEVVPVGAEGREPVKSAAEYSPAVEQKVNELSDANMRKLAQAHGLEPNEYDLNARDERRHRVERDQLAKDITEQMGEDEKINLGRAAASAEKEGLFQGADTSAKGRAARAEKMFPRLRGPVDENGNPKVSGGAPETVGTKEAADKDTEHFANAKKELGDKASISDVAKRAQELKDESAKPRFKPVGHDEYAKAVKDNPQAATLTDPEAMKNNKAFSNGKGVYYSISPEGDLQGVINNSGDKGALKQAVPHAIANGAKTLDAWDIYLPKQYEKYGFERTKSVPYDAKHYGEPTQNLKDAWKAQGWKEGDPYPSVQYMKLKEGEGPATFEAHHWSNTPDLTETNPEKMGTGVRGAERARMNEPGFLKRTNFGTEGYKEPAVQGQKYHYVSDLEASKYYDAQKDPEGIWKKGFKESGATGAEKAVRDAGYHGYRSGNEVASFEKVPVRPAESKPDFSMVKDADGKPDRLEITHKGEPKGHLKIEEQVPGTWTIKDAAVKPGEQRQGLGKAALEQTLIEAKQAGAKAVESDISHTTKAKGMWDAIQKNHPDAVTEENGQYSVELSKLGKKKSPYGEIKVPKK